MIIGIIGCGKQAPKHIKGFRAAGIEDIRVCDLDHERAEMLANAMGVTAVKDVPTLLSSGVEAVSICTPTPSHASLIRQCIMANVHWLCEKPLCEDVATGEALLVETNEANLVGAVGWVYRHVPALKQGKMLVEEQLSPEAAIGKIDSAIFRIGGRGNAMAWKHYKAQGGGAIQEMMVHMVDLAQWYFGKPEKVTLLERELRRSKRFIQGQTHEVDAEDWVLASLKFENGISALLQADLTTPAFTQYIELHGDNGSFASSIQPDYASFIFLNEARGQWPAGRTALEVQPHNLYHSQMEAFVNDIKKSTRETADTLEASIEVMRTVKILDS